MYVCMYSVYIYICMYELSIYVCMYVLSIYVCMYSVYMYVCMYSVYMYVCMYSVYMYVCTHNIYEKTITYYLAIYLLALALDNETVVSGICLHMDGKLSSTIADLGHYLTDVSKTLPLRKL